MKAFSNQPSAISRKQSRGERGIALIMTLAIIALVTLMVIAFSVSMRVENMASKNFNDQLKARQIAQAAVDQAVATIRSATEIPTTLQTWVAAPGVIYVADPAAVTPITPVHLYTEAAVAGTDPVELNTGYFVTGQNALYTTLGPGGVGGDANITPDWQNLTTLIGGVTELRGRFAYWCDVEATKVNVNTAGTRTAPNPMITTDPLMNQSIPSDIDLRALEAPFYNDGAKVADLVTERSNPPLQPPFSTVEEMRRRTPPTPPMSKAEFDGNKFFATVGTTEPNTDAFGRDRINIQAIIDESAPEYTDAYNRLNDPAWADVLYPSVVTDLNRKTLVGKYGEYGVRQILANIIEYQNANEHSIPVGNTVLDANDLPPNYSGLKKSPLITDVIVHVATNYVVNGTTGFPDLILRVFVDVRLINIYDQDRGGGYQILVDPLSIKYTPTGGSETDMTVSEEQRTINALNPVSAHSYSLLGAPSGAGFLGTYPPPEWTVTIPGTAPEPNYPTLDRVKVTLRRVRLLHTAGNPNSIVDWMSPDDFNEAYPSGIEFLPTQFVKYDLSLPSPQFSSPPYVADRFQPIGLEKLDPRTRTFSGGLALANGQPSLKVNWVSVQGNNFNTSSANRSWSASVLGVVRDERTPSLFNLLADVRYMEPVSEILNPTLRYLGNYREGLIQSLGELTYIHTGYPLRTIRFRSVVPTTTGLNGVASPLLDAQAITDGTFGDRNTTIGAQNVERDALPDWILLDVFKVGSAATFDGRINLNTRFTGPAAALTPRTVPLAALINESTVNLAVGGSAEGQLNTIAGNIANRVPAVGSPYGGLLAYFTPGEICEIRDLEFFDDTVSGTAAYNQRPSKTRRQQLVRRVSNLVTARSNAFTIWALAQTIKEVGTPDGIFNGQDFVTGEVKVQAIVERYEDPPGLDGILGNTDDVKFRTKYLRYVYE